MYATLLLVAHSAFMGWVFHKAGYDFSNPATRMRFIQLTLLDAILFIGYSAAWKLGV